MQTERALEALLSSRLFVTPQLVGERLYFLSDLSGKLSLYDMPCGGGVPRPLLPTGIAMQNPKIMAGPPFLVLPTLDKILVMLDKDGDENYQPNFIPTGGGFPERVFGDELAMYKVLCVHHDASAGVVYFQAEHRSEPVYDILRADLTVPAWQRIHGGPLEPWPAGFSKDHRKALVRDMYTEGDRLLWLWEQDAEKLRLLLGTPKQDRPPNAPPVLNGIEDGWFVEDDRAILLRCALFDDTYGVVRLALDEGAEPEAIAVEGFTREGPGQLENFSPLRGDLFLLKYNAGGSTVAVEARYEPVGRRLVAVRQVLGAGDLSGGVADGLSWDEQSKRYVLSYSDPTSPSQLHTLEGEDLAVVTHTDERVLGIPREVLAKGEDVSFTSHDGLTVAARLYLPAGATGMTPPYPVVFWIHGGPHCQEQPDFTWFSMPLIQLLTLKGIAVYVPNARGSDGYGLDYMCRVDRDWGGQDRLDHVHAHKLLREDPRLDLDRAGVAGRSYGGYMTLTLAARHPELWKAAIDLFGPCNLPVFIHRLPAAWQPYFHEILGHPERDKEELEARSPFAHLPKVTCPMLVIQGANDPRVPEIESREIVEDLRRRGQEAEYLLFDDEGHDVVKRANKIRCYGAMVRFFRRHLCGETIEV